MCTIIQDGLLCSVEGYGYLPSFSCFCCCCRLKSQERERADADAPTESWMWAVQAQKVSDLRRQIQQTLRPNAISLVDSWAFTDYELHSALGREDGDVYSALLNMAKGSPLNKTDEGAALKLIFPLSHCALLNVFLHHHAKSAVQVLFENADMLCFSSPIPDKMHQGTVCDALFSDFYRIQHKVCIQHS